MIITQIHGVWDALAQTFGTRFYEQYGERPNEAWTAALASMTPDAAMCALQALISDGVEFPPTLPQFVSLARKWRPEQGLRPALPNPGRREPTIEELRRNASPEVGAFATYRDYERWRDAHTSKGKRPPHPEPQSPDWLYLQRIAWLAAAAHNRQVTAAATGHAA